MQKTKLSSILCNEIGTISPTCFVSGNRSALVMPKPTTLSDWYKAAGFDYVDEQQTLSVTGRRGMSLPPLHTFQMPLHQVIKLCNP